MDYVTKIINLHFPQRRNWWCLFGRPSEVRSISAINARSRAEIFSFSAGTVFGISHQRFNEYGLTNWEIWFLRACRPGDEVAVVPGVKPGAEILLYVRGKKSAAVIQDYLEILTMRGIAPETVGPLHQRTAPYLERGVIPKELIDRYLLRSCHE